MTQRSLVLGWQNSQRPTAQQLIDRATHVISPVLRPRYPSPMSLKLGPDEIQKSAQRSFSRSPVFSKPFFSVPCTSWLQEKQVGEKSRVPLLQLRMCQNREAPQGGGQTEGSFWFPFNMHALKTGERTVAWQLGRSFRRTDRDRTATGAPFGGTSWTCPRRSCSSHFSGCAVHTGPRLGSKLAK